MKKIVVLALMSALVTTPALAGGNVDTYIAADYGSPHYKNVDYPGVGTQPNPRMVRVAAGYHFSPMLAAEVGYSWFGDSVIIDAVGAQGIVTANSLQIAAVLSLPLSSRLDLIGKLGLTNNNQKFEVKRAGVSYGAIGASKLDVLAGLGAQIRVNSDFTVRVQYERFGSFGEYVNFGQKMKVAGISAGVVMSF